MNYEKQYQPGPLSRLQPLDPQCCEVKRGDVKGAINYLETEICELAQHFEALTAILGPVMVSNVAVREQTAPRPGQATEVGGMIGVAANRIADLTDHLKGIISSISL